MYMVSLCVSEQTLATFFPSYPPELERRRTNAMLDMLERAESFVQQSETATKNDTRKMNPDSAVGSQEVLLGECLKGKFTERSSHHRRVFVIVSNGVNINIIISFIFFFSGISYFQC